MSQMKVPFNRISLVGGELENINRAIASGALHGDGAFTKECEVKIGRASGAPAALLTNSGTAALDIAAILCDLRPGDEVIAPAYTFVSTANAFVLRGAKPVFCDVRRDTLNIDESKIEELVTPRTRVIVPVHYAGVSCEMDAILDIAARRNLVVVEDAAQGFNSFYKGRALGSMGELGALSFHGTKNVMCGEGGALLVNSPDLRERAYFVREKGTNRIQFVEGKIDKYTWVDIGDSYIPSELTAAFLSAQLDARDSLTSPRVAAWNRYFARLSPLEASGRISLPKIPPHCAHNAHIFFLIAGSEAEAKSLSEFLKSRGVASAQHYAPLHLCPMARKLGCDARSLPVAEEVAKSMLRLPIFASISDGEVDYVCDCVEAFYAAK